MFPRTGLFVLGTALAVLLLAACGSERSGVETAADLDAQVVERTFRVVSVTEAGVDRPLVGGESWPLTLRFEDDGTLRGSACNSFWGPYEIVEGALVIMTPEFGQKLAACGLSIGTTPGTTAPDPMEEEAWYQDFLKSEPTLDLDGDRLTLTSGDTVVVLVAQSTSDIEGATIPPTTDASAPPPTSEPIGGGSALAGRSFHVVSVSEDGTDRGLVGDLGLSFDDDGTFAAAGCNRSTGRFEVVDATLLIGDDVMTTLAGCLPEELMTQDDWFVAFLQSEPTLALDGDQLTLTGGDTVVVLVEPPPPVDVGLTGVTWELYSIVEGQTVGSVPADVVATLVFGEDGSVQVDTGCNTGSGGYEVSGDVISLEPLALTEIACDEDSSRVEAAVTGVLDGDVDFQQDGNVLTLRAAPGAALEYRTAEAEPGNPGGTSTVEPPATTAG